MGAPTLKVEFVGRLGKAQRRKVLSGKYKPSKVLSEGEQKVLAMADCLACLHLSFRVRLLCYLREANGAIVFALDVGAAK